MFANEHPSYVVRRLEAQNHKLRKIAEDMTSVDPSDGEAMRQALSTMAGALSEIAMATGTLAQWVARNR